MKPADVAQLRAMLKKLRGVSAQGVAQELRKVELTEVEKGVIRCVARGAWSVVGPG